MLNSCNLAKMNIIQPSVFPEFLLAFGADESDHIARPHMLVRVMSDIADPLLMALGTLRHLYTDTP